MFSLLQFCPSSVRSCFGCSQTLKLGGTIALPPYDMVITFENATTIPLANRRANARRWACLFSRQYQLCQKKTAVLRSAKNNLSAVPGATFNSRASRLNAMAYPVSLIKKQDSLFMMEALI